MSCMPMSAASPPPVRSAARAAGPPARRGTALIGLWLARSAQRSAMRAWIRADARDQAGLLRDIGISRAQAAREAAKWFWQR